MKRMAHVLCVGKQRSPLTSQAQNWSVLFLETPALKRRRPYLLVNKVLESPVVRFPLLRMTQMRRALLRMTKMRLGFARITRNAEPLVGMDHNVGIPSKHSSHLGKFQQGLSHLERFQQAHLSFGSFLATASRTSGDSSKGLLIWVIFSSICQDSVW